MNIKKIIAREGLIIILFVLLSSATFFSAKTIYNIADHKHTLLVFEYPKIQELINNHRPMEAEKLRIIVRNSIEQVTTTKNKLVFLIKYTFPFAITCYIIYTLIHFILWAIRTLKARE